MSEKDDVNNARKLQKITGIGLAKIETKLQREYSDFPYIKIGVKHLVIKEKLPEWFDKHKGEEL